MAADPLSVLLLGHVSAERGGRPVEVNGAQRLAMLTMLALRAGEPVSSADLVDGIWDGEAPDRASHAVHVHVSELRAALGADAIETRRGSYRLCVDEEQVDALLFEQLLGRVNGGPPEQTLAALQDALALWRGPAFDGAAGSAALRAAAARLDEERLSALELRFDVELALGHHHQILGELTSVVAAMPLRESLRAQLMLALYRAGRQVDALAVCREGRAELRELGLEPGSELRDLERAILCQDPALAQDGATIRRAAARFDDETLQGVVAFAESWSGGLRNYEPEALAAVTERSDELAAAFEHAIARGAKEAGVRLIAATWFYWIIRGAQRRADVWAQAIMALPDELTAAYEMEGQVAASELARVNGDFGRAVRLKKLARSTAEEVGEARLAAGLDADLAHLFVRLGELDVAEAYAQSALESRRSNPNDLCGVGHALVAVGEVHEARGEYAEAISAYEDAVADQEGAGFGGEAAFIRGHLLGRAHRKCGSARAAYGAYRLALNEAQPLGDYGTVAVALQGLAWVAAVHGDERGAVRLLGEASRPEWLNALDSEEHAAFDEDVAVLRRDVSEAVFDAAWRIGAAR